MIFMAHFVRELPNQSRYGHLPCTQNVSAIKDQIVALKTTNLPCTPHGKLAKTRIPQRVGRATLYSNESRDDELSIEYRVYAVI